MVVTTIVLALAYPAFSAADTFDDPGFATEVVASVPPYTLVGLAFAPDGRLFVWQKNGVVRIIKNGVMLSTPFVDLSSHVNTFDDRGMWGLAFDPNFASNGYVYVSYTYENTGNPNDQGRKTARLTRIAASPTNPDVALPGETVIMGSVGTPPCSAQPVGADCIPSDGGSHTIGELHFATDGTLLIGVGDGADGGPSDPLPLRAQNLDSINGKILRVNKDGTAPADNPFYDGTNSIRSKVWLYGVRNPFRFSVDEATGDLWFGEVGWDTWEEVDHGVKGGNYGWPCFEGNAVNVTYQSAGECLALPPGSARFPYVTWNHSVGTAAIGGPIYTGTLYPQQYQGNYFYADYTGNFIRRIVFDGDRNPVQATSFATNVPSPVSLEQGPDGMIYYNSFTTGEIRRIRFNGPVANASGMPTHGYSPLTVTFSSVGSLNPGGGSLTYLWDFGDGQTSTAANPIHTYIRSGVSSLTARLTVTSTTGVSSSATVPIVVGSTPPAPTITAPVDGTSVLPGQVVSFQGSATDPDDGALGSSALKWTVLLHHNTHVHTFVGGTGTSGSFVAENHGTIGTFAYEIILEATDSSGLKTTTSVNVPVAQDTVPPSAPSGLTAVAQNSSQVQLSWSPSTDNAAVERYRVERCQGAGCSSFTQVGAPSTTSFGDTPLSASTTYRYRVSAVDVSGNMSGYSAVVDVATPAGPVLPAGLVAGYSFDAGSGSSVMDVSGNGNTGTVQGASWSTQGRYGGAMSFNGSGSLVQVASSASLGLSSAMTLSAWINPAASQSGWRTIVQRQVDAYFLNASNDSGPLRPAGGATVGGATRWVGGPSASPVGSWTHVALTYSGSQLLLYVNGVQVASAAASGAVQASSSPLWIGGNQPYGEYFQGLIDDVRVYNRALSQAEIQTDMATPLGGATLDTTPPSVPANVVASAVGPSQVSVSWSASTDNVGVTGYRLERCQGAGCTGFAQVGAPSGTSFGDTGLSASTSYSYRAVALDAAGNVSGYSNVASVTTPATADTTPPSAPTGVAATAVSSSQVNLSWTASTDNLGVTGYRVERCQGSGCTSFAQIGTSTGTSFNDTGLSASTSYSYRLVAVDAAGNVSGYSTTATATTPATADTTPPSAPTGVAATAVSSSQVNLSWTASTDNLGVTGYRVERCQGSGCTSFAQIGTPSGTTFNDTGLTAGTLYRYRVRATDAAGNLSAYSSIVNGTTQTAGDTTAPTAPTNLAGTAPSPSQISLSWTASTDNIGVTGYRVERCQGQNCSGFAQVAMPSGTSFGDSGLAANTYYRYRVRAADAAGNLSAYSSIVRVRTLAADTTAPSAPPNLVATAAGPSQVNLSWSASTDNVGVAGYRVERCQGAGCTTWAQVGTPSGTSFGDTGLSASTTYRYRVRAVDAAGNLGSYSGIATTTTQAVADTTPPSAPTNLAATAVSSSQVNLTWTASTDNVGVTGYRVERCQGDGCTGFAQVGAPSTASFGDSGLSASTSYTYRVVAVDAAGNVSAYSVAASTSTPAGSVLPAGLVAAYSFDAGSGSSVADVTGNGNTGAMTGGVSWSPAGRYGGALSFNGSSGLVQVAASPSLGLSGAMTLSGWIDPAASQSGWRTIVQRQVDAYFLNASNGSGALRPSGGGTLGGSVQWVGGTTPSPVGSWTHLALTYDGSALRLYVNGVQAATLAASGTIQSSSSPLFIGGNQPYGEYFNGLIDDVRVYNRALSPAEIQTDMATPLGS